MHQGLSRVSKKQELAMLDNIQTPRAADMASSDLKLGPNDYHRSLL